MSTDTPLGQSSTAAFIAAVNAIVRQQDFFDDGTVQVYDLRESGDGISVSVMLEATSKTRSSIKLPKRRLDVEMDTLDTISAITIDGRDLPNYAWNKDSDFAAATVKVKLIADQMFEQIVEDMRSQAIQEEWAESDAMGALREQSLDELEMEFDAGLGNPKRTFTRRQAFHELSRLACEATRIRRL